VAVGTFPVRACGDDDASVLLALLVSPWFLVLTAFVGVKQWLYVGVRTCPASLVLERVVGIEKECGR
jgi:hypothetical protein